jgi:hypothetical protein
MGFFDIFNFIFFSGISKEKNAQGAAIIRQILM